jgi:DNA polymerase I-like protein with 3'-5' exonuclease and polymerase domains
MPKRYQNKDYKLNLITVDFETYFSTEFSLTKMTTEEYVRDDQFEVVGVAVKVNEEKTRWFTGDFEQTKSWLEQFDWENSFVLAHNMQFDGAILSWLFGIKAKVWLDTLCMARAVHGVDAGGSLSKLVERYELGVKGDDTKWSKGLHRKDFSLAQMNQYAEYCKNDVDLTYELFMVMAQDFPKRELKVIDTTLRMFIEPKLELDLPLLEQHLEDVKNKKEALLEAAAADKDTLMSNDKFAELLKMLKVDPPTKISARTGKVAWAFAKTDEEFKELASHPDLRVQALVAARLGNKTTLEETRTQRFIDIAKRGKLPVPLKYYGARTGRWSAEGSINMQNVPRDSALKKAIQAPEGYALVGADLSNIELRVGLWLAGQHDKLQLLSSGVDLYKDFASSVFGVPYEQVTKEQRFIGKTSQLSLIYGVGAVKLRNAIKTGSGVDIGEDEAVRIVSLYRQEYNKVKSIWERGSTAIEAIHNNTTTQFAYGDVAIVEGKKGIRLPTGLYMQYPELRQETTDGKTGWVYKKRNGVDRLYGAKLFQGLTQAVARCVMAEQMLKVSKRYAVVLTIHDALYMFVTDNQAAEALEFVLGTMRETPEWLPGIVLDAEGAYGKSLADCYT